MNTPIWLDAEIKDGKLPRAGLGPRWTLEQQEHAKDLLNARGMSAIADSIGSLQFDCVELCSQLREIYDWTDYKHTIWAEKTKALLDRIEIKRDAEKKSPDRFDA